MITAFAAQTHERWLSESERRVLLALFEVRLRLSSGQIQFALQDRTGRTISTAQICRNRRRADRLGKSQHPCRHLTEAQRSVLTMVCRQAAPKYHTDTIARRFAEETGRKIARKTVLYFLETRFGLEPRR